MKIFRYVEHVKKALVLQNSSFEPSCYFHIKWVQDAVLVPTCRHMASQNAPNSGFGGVLQPLRVVLGASWAILEAS